MKHKLNDVRQVVAAIIRQQRVEPGYGRRELTLFSKPEYVRAELAAIEQATRARDAAVVGRWLKGCTLTLGPVDVAGLDEWGTTPR